MIRFYKLHWEYIWHAHPQSFLDTCFSFFCCFQQILQISCNDQLVRVFFQTMKVSLFCIFEKHYYILMIVKIVANLVCICSCFEMFNLRPSALSTSIFERESHNEQLYSFKNRIPYYHNVNSHILLHFQNQKFVQLAVVCNFKSIPLLKIKLDHI